MSNGAAIASLVVLTLTTASMSADQSGSVEVRKQTDPITDEDRSAAFVTGPNGTVIMFRCMADGLNVQFGYGKYFIGSNDKVTVVHRFPPAVASDPTRWDISTDNLAAFLPTSQVAAFMKQAVASDSVVLRATDRDGDQVTAQFKLVGLAAALKQLGCYKAPG